MTVVYTNILVFKGISNPQRVIGFKPLHYYNCWKCTALLVGRVNIQNLAVLVPIEIKLSSKFQKLVVAGTKIK